MLLAFLTTLIIGFNVSIDGVLAASPDAQERGPPSGISMERSPLGKQLRAQGSARLTLPYHLEAMQRLHAKEAARCAEEARLAETDFMVRLYSISGEVLQEMVMKGEHRIRDLVPPWSRVFDPSFTEVYHSCEFWRSVGGADQIDLTSIEAGKESAFYVEYTWPDASYIEAVLGDRLSAESDV